jgi:hypothetical protein
MFLEISSATDRQIGRDTNFMAECAGQTRIR